MVVLEVLDKLALVTAKRVRCHETQDAARPDEVEYVDLTRHPVSGGLVDLLSFLALGVPGPVFDPTATAEGEPVGTYVLPVGELQRLAIQNDLLQLLLVLVLRVVGALEFVFILRVE